MNKTELVNSVAEAAELSKKDSTKVVETVVDTITEALKKGDKVDILGFGSFAVAARAARKGRNPATGKEIEIPAMKVPTFKAGKTLRTVVKTSL